MNSKNYMRALFIHLFCILFSPVFSQIDELKYREVRLEEFEESYQKKFTPYQDSTFFKDPRTFLDMGYMQVYKGNDEVGNYLMNFALDHYTEKNADLYHMLSVQNTKNGNYGLAVSYLDSAASYSKERYGYYGWVMLHYYRDYERALKYLAIYDSLTPNFSDFPVGENIHYLKGLAYMQLKKYPAAVDCFNTYIDEETNRIGRDWVDNSTFYYKGICLEKMNDFKEAHKNYKMAIQLNHQFVEAIYRRAMLTNKKRKKLSDLLYVEKLIKQGHSKTDVYMEIFHPVYLQEVQSEILKLK